VSTIHRDKGLEFDHVWVAGVEEGRLPHRRALQDGQEHEERRLAYVAVTRARRTLHVSWSARRGTRRREPSRYHTAIAGDAATRPGGTAPRADAAVRVRERTTDA
jgi:superfamily I DNA/RNA helicase